MKNDTKSKSKKKNTKTAEDKSTDVSPNTDDGETAVQAEKKPPPKRKAKPKKNDDKTGTESPQSQQDKAPEKESKPKSEPKPKKEPMVPPGEWVAPEMESALYALHDRLKMEIGTVTNRIFGENVVIPVKKDEIPEFEESDNNLPKIDVDKVLVRLSNGEVYESPRYDIFRKLNLILIQECKRYRIFHKGLAYRMRVLGKVIC